MRTKLFVMGLAAAVMICFSGTGAWAGDRFEQIQEKQRKEIHQAFRSGKISRWEYERLNAEQRQIERARKQALKDRRLTRQERIQLEKMQDQAAKNIRSAKRGTNQGKRDSRYNDRDHSARPDFRPDRRY